MTKAGLPVPGGFVVLAGAFDRFLEETEIKADIEAILKKVNHKDVNSVDKASAEIRELIMEEKVPADLQEEILGAYGQLFNFTTPSRSAGHPSLKKEGKTAPGFVAVRSSATAEDSSVASWAGELETYLNVTEKNVIGSVKKCWSSLFTPRAIFYAFEKGFYKTKKSPTSPRVKPGAGSDPSSGRRGIRISVAVVVQKMVQSEVSGITFTVHPVTKDKNQMVVEAGFGLGEAIVGGMVTPDTYIIHKNDFSILDINVSEQTFAIVKTPKGNINKKLSKTAGGKQKLTGKQIVEIAKICKNIEKHYKKPQDIEWAFEGGKFYITQSRPITTL
jgi:pyruvate,water dikinase